MISNIVSLSRFPNIYSGICKFSNLISQDFFGISFFGHFFCPFLKKNQKHSWKIESCYHNSFLWSGH
jgi:hypothetical protein